MKIKFLPKKSIEVEICDIYEGRDAIVVQHTDTLRTDTAYNGEALGFKYGIKPTAFHWPYNGIQNELREINKTGVLRFGVYVSTDRYRISDTDYGYLPDYSATTISESGAEYYGKPLGSSKPAGYPNQGQELFNFSGGVKGYNISGSVPGSESNIDFIREMEFVDGWYMSHFGRLPSSGADRQGKIGSKEVYLPYYLGIRSTTYNGNVDYYNLERLDMFHKPLTSRWENGFISGQKPLFNQRVIDGINLAFTEKGFFVDFVHWHRTIAYGGIEQLQELYQLIYDTVAGRNVWYTGYSEAVEYYWFRQMTKRVRGSIVDGSLYLIADFDDEFIKEHLAGIDKKLLYSRIKQPLSVKIDLTGTEFAGLELAGADMISLGNNQYIVDIPFEIADNGFKSVVLTVTDTPDYKDFTVPVLSSNDDGLITTNVPTKAVLFNNDFNQTMTAVRRSNNLGTVHNLTGSSGTKVGIVSKWGISSLIDL